MVVSFSSSVQSAHDNNARTTTSLGSSSPSGDSLVPHFGYGMDCNGYSPVYPNAPYHTICSDPSASPGSSWDGRYYDNGHYIGHDEPDAQFYSNATGSGDNLEWALTLPKDPSLPPTQNGSVIDQFELEPAFWLGWSLCDPWSDPFNPCTPDSDSNVGGGATFATGQPANAAGAANLELQFYPPYNLERACGAKWCVAISLDSFEPGSPNNSCGEPNNAAWIQMNGIPTGPPGPGEQTYATASINNETLLLNGGDHILVKMNDTSAGAYIGIQDLSTGKSGFMVMSAANGFMHTNVKDCSTQPFSFHPEFATAKPGNVNPWTTGGDYVSLAFEIGHFELGHGNNDSDDGGCGVFRGVNFCSAGGGGGTTLDSDFDSLSYYASSWSNGSSDRPTSIAIGNSGNSGVGPASWDGKGYTLPYDTIRFTTLIGNINPNCNASTGAGCTIPPGAAEFYPYYSLSGNGTQCVMNFGNSIPGVTTNTFGGDEEYGSSDPYYHITIEGPFVANPCGSDLQRLSINYSIPNANALSNISLPKPSLRYLKAGQLQSTSLTSGSTIIYADPESQWNLTESQASLPSGIRIEGVGPTSGNLSETTSVSLTYYLQAQMQFAYKVDDGGSSYTPPVVQYFALGTPNDTSNATVWADLGSTYTYASQLGGSNATERWEANQTEITGNVIRSETIAPSYYHQYLVSLVASPSGFGTVSPSQSQWYNAGAIYPINANPSSGYSFSGWNSSSSLLAIGVTSSSSTTVKVNGPGTIQARFQSIASTSTSSSSSSAVKNGGAGIPASLQLVIVAIVIIVVVGGSFVIVRRR